MLKTFYQAPAFKYLIAFVLSLIFSGACFAPRWSVNFNDPEMEACYHRGTILMQRAYAAGGKRSLWLEAAQEFIPPALAGNLKAVHELGVIYHRLGITDVAQFFFQKAAVEGYMPSHNCLQLLAEQKRRKNTIIDHCENQGNNNQYIHRSYNKSWADERVRLLAYSEESSHYAAMRLADMALQEEEAGESVRFLEKSIPAKVNSRVFNDLYDLAVTIQTMIGPNNRLLFVGRSLLWLKKMMELIYPEHAPHHVYVPFSKAALFKEERIADDQRQAYLTFLRERLRQVVLPKGAKLFVMGMRDTGRTMMASQFLLRDFSPELCQNMETILIAPTHTKPILPMQGQINLYINQATYGVLNLKHKKSRATALGTSFSRSKWESWERNKEYLNESPTTTEARLFMEQMQGWLDGSAGLF